MQTMRERVQDIEHRYDRNQASSNVGTEAVMDALEITNDGDHRQAGLRIHAFIANAFMTQFAVVRNAVYVAEARIGQGDAIPIDLFNPLREVLVMHFYSSSISSYHPSLVIERQYNLMPTRKRHLYGPSCWLVADCVLVGWERAIQLRLYGYCLSASVADQLSVHS